MKFLKFIKKYPFMSLLALSTLIFAMIGYVGKNNIYSNYSISILKTPQLAAVFEGFGEGKYPWMIQINQKKADNTDQQQLADTDHTAGGRKFASQGADNVPTGINSADPTISAIGEKSNETRSDLPNKAAITGAARKDEVTGKAVKSSQDNDIKATDKRKDANTFAGKDSKKNPTKPAKEKKEAMHLSKDGKIVVKSQDADKTSDEAATKAPDKGNIKKSSYKFKTVSVKYFNDALFIGDSRTVGLSEYSGWKNTTFYADVGLTVYDLFERKIAELDGKKVTVPEALKSRKFRKIYIMVGINELGTGTTKTFIEQYKKVLAKIQELQPDAIIFAEGIMDVAKGKSDTDPIFNNKNINEKNENIAKLADNKNIFYIDVNEAITDETGNLPSNYTFDNIHLKAAYYKLWTAFLLKHGVNI